MQFSLKMRHPNDFQREYLNRKCEYSIQFTKNILPSNLPMSVSRRTRKFSRNSKLKIIFLWKFHSFSSLYLVLLHTLNTVLYISNHKEQLMEHFEQKKTNSSIVIVSREELLTGHVFRYFQYVEPYGGNQWPCNERVSVIVNVLLSTFLNIFHSINPILDK